MTERSMVFSDQEMLEAELAHLREVNAELVGALKMYQRPEADLSQASIRILLAANANRIIEKAEATYD